MKLLALTTLLTLTTLTTSALAKCEAKNSSFIWGSDADVTLYMNKGERCGVRLAMRGSMVDSINIVSPAKNGVADTVGLTAFVYVPKPGFVGADAFKVRAIGSSNSAKGPIIFNVSAVVK